MKIHQSPNRPTYSFEIFPPKRDADMNQIFVTLEQIVQYRPDFISVTYGASGSQRGTETLDICAHIKEKHKIEPLMHLTCAGSDRATVDRILERAKEQGIENALLMRGDRREDLTEEEQFGDFHHASELIEYAKARYDFSVGGACYPEGHVEARSVTSDLLHLRRKVRLGADFLITQFFFDNDKFYHFLNEARSIDIDIPILAGVMPVLNKNQIHRMVQLSGASLPEKFKRIMDRYEHNPAALQDAGIAYASEQIVDLLSSGVDGIHLYVMNKPEIARRITENIGSILHDLRSKK